jgi:hypothetical protein
VGAPGGLELEAREQPVAFAGHGVGVLAELDLGGAREERLELLARELRVHVSRALQLAHLLQQLDQLGLELAAVAGTTRALVGELLALGKLREGVEAGVGSVQGAGHGILVEPAPVPGHAVRRDVRDGDRHVVQGGAGLCGVLHRGADPLDDAKRGDGSLDPRGQGPGPADARGPTERRPDQVLDERLAKRQETGLGSALRLELLLPMQASTRASSTRAKSSENSRRSANRSRRRCIGRAAAGAPGRRRSRACTVDGRCSPSTPKR